MKQENLNSMRERLSEFLDDGRMTLSEFLKGDVQSLVSYSLHSLKPLDDEGCFSEDDDESNDQTEDDKHFANAFASHILHKMFEYDAQQREVEYDVYEYERRLLAKLSIKNTQDLRDRLRATLPPKSQRKLDALCKRYDAELAQKNSKHKKFATLAKQIPKLDLLKHKQDDGKSNWDKRLRYRLYKMFRINPKSRYAGKIKGRFIALFIISLIMTALTTVLAFSALNGVFGASVAAIAASGGAVLLGAPIVFILIWIVGYTIFSIISSSTSKAYSDGLSSMMDEPNSMKFLRGWHKTQHKIMEGHLLPWLDAVSKGNFRIGLGKLTILDGNGNHVFVDCNSCLFAKMANTLHCMYEKKKHAKSSYFKPFLDITPHLIEQLREFSVCMAQLERSDLNNFESSCYVARLQISAQLMADALRKCPTEDKVFCDNADFIKSEYKDKNEPEDKLGFVYDKKEGGHRMNNLAYLLTYINFMSSAEKVDKAMKGMNKHTNHFNDRIEGTNFVGFQQEETNQKV